MKFDLLGDIPSGPLWVACSGGVDSVFAADFLRQVPARELGLAYFNHGSSYSGDAEAFVAKLADHWGLPFKSGRIKNKEVPKGTSQEEHWRSERYAFLDTLDGHVVTGHNLDDCVETWLWSSCHGTPHTIPYSRNRVIRPFMLVRRKDIESWVERKGLTWMDDPSNQDLRFMRNYIRHQMMPHVLRVNPGIHPVVARRVKEAFSAGYLPHA